MGGIRGCDRRGLAAVRRCPAAGAAVPDPDRGPRTVRAHGPARAGDPAVDAICRDLRAVFRRDSAAARAAAAENHGGSFGRAIGLARVAAGPNRVRSSAGAWAKRLLTGLAE